MNRFHLLGFIGVLASQLIVLAAPFQDLNFDSANTNNLVDASGTGDYGASASDLLPGWTVLAGSTVLTSAGFNLPEANSIFSPAYGAHHPIVGLYSFVMDPHDSRGQFFPISLSQTGDLPIDVRSIHFLSYDAPLELQVNGSIISLTYTPATRQPEWNPGIPAFDVVGDISPFAGQTVELKFTTLPSPTLPSNGLDEITFSTIAIPEPSILLLFSLGGLAWLVRRIRRG